MDGVKSRLPSPRRIDHAGRGASFNSSPLLRLLAGLGVAELAAPTLSLAERWSPWLAWTDAITLSAVLGAGVPALPALAKTGAAARAVIDECKRVRHDLAQAISTDGVFMAGMSSKPAPAQDAAPMDEAGFAGLHRQYQAHQRAMDQRIVALRAQVRATLADQGGDLGRLAALDAVLDEALAARQRRLLASVPGWLDRHFKRAPVALPAAATQAQRLLLAELDLRLQPVEGMIEALADAGRDRAGNQAGNEATHPAMRQA